jgi:hypothetical protein
MVGNHGEDEGALLLNGFHTHALYMKMLYKYPQQEFPFYGWWMKTKRDQNCNPN